MKWKDVGSGLMVFGGELNGYFIKINDSLTLYTAKENSATSGWIKLIDCKPRGDFERVDSIHHDPPRLKPEKDWLNAKLGL